MELIPITPRGQPAEAIPNPEDIVAEVLGSTAEMYRRRGYEAPWIGYLAVEDGICVGTCAFKSPPRGGRVEIAYFTFPGHEGRGVARRMAAALVGIARRESPDVTVAAQTQPKEGASTSVLERSSFHFVAEREHPEDGRVWEWELTPAPERASRSGRWRGR